jgi:predicted RNA-binding protein associated with RNAse of E/G family
MEVSLEEFEGAIGLIEFLSVTEPFICVYDNKPITVAEKDYYWLQVAPKNQDYWLTVTLSPQGEIVHLYFDITDGNVILENGESWYYDLFLDIVMLPNGALYLLDEDELKQALDENIITLEQYDKAYLSAGNIMRDMKRNPNDLFDFCKKYFQILKSRLQ